MSKWAAAWPLGIGVLIGTLAAGVLLVVSSSPRGEAIRLSTPPGPPPVIVHVNGAVANPGVYELPHGSRVQDAIQAAGGSATPGGSRWAQPGSQPRRWCADLRDFRK